MATGDLTDKQKLFIDAYVGVANCNATEAARLAGYSPETAYAIGAENLKKPQIRSAIDARLLELTMGPEEILARLTAHARGNLKDITNGTGALPANLKGLTREQAAIIKKHSVRKGKDGTTVSVELYDAQAALRDLAKRYALFPDKLDVDLNERDIDQAIGGGLADLAGKQEAEAA